MRFATSQTGACTLMNFAFVWIRSVLSVQKSLLVLSLGALAGCSSTTSPQRYGASDGSVDPRYGVRPSPRVVADGEEIPRGGGKYLVGNSYSIGGKTYYPSEKPAVTVGTASWYGSDFHGRRTANGEIFDRNSISAAHPTMPLPSYARVTNLRNTRSMIVRVNDRGPFHEGRVMDVSQRVAEALDFRGIGTTRVKVEYVGRARLEGSDDATLLATLRDDGRPATLEGISPVLTAAREEPVRTAALERLRQEDAGHAQAKSDEEDRNGESADGGSFGAPLTSAPLPPSRPFDLGAIGNAHAPTKAGGKRAIN
jgi:rare lipoprotein A